MAGLPARNVGRFGRPGDPHNLLFLGSGPALRGALEDGGWTLLPRTLAGSVLGGLGQLARGRPLTLFPPMNTYRLLGRAQEQNWVRVTRPLIQRHHFRLWSVPFADPQGRPAWWGSANYDKAARFHDLSHVPDPDIDAERDFIAGTLGASAKVEGAEHMARPGLPRNGVNDKGYPFFTDGRVLVVRLRL